MEYPESVYSLGFHMFEAMEEMVHCIWSNVRPTGAMFQMKMEAMASIFPMSLK